MTEQILQEPGENGPAIPVKPDLHQDAKTKSPAGSFVSVLIFALVGYFVWKSNIRAAVIITVVILIHELGHLLAMKFYNYSNLSIFLIPMIGGIASGTKKDI